MTARYAPPVGRSPGAGTATAQGPYQDLLLSRRPILDRGLGLHGYELTYRELPTDAPERSAAALLVDGIIGLGRARLSGGRPTLVAVGAPLLRSGVLLALPPEGLEVGIPELPDAAACVDAVAALHGQGVRTVLLRTVPGDPRLTLLEHVDVLAVDAAADRPDKRLVADIARDRGLELMTTGVSTLGQLDAAWSDGSVLLQGDALLGAQPVRGRRPRGFDVAHLDLLAALREERLDPAEIEALLRRDLVLADRFLRFVNAARFGWRQPIGSLRHAVVLVGERRLRQWLLLLLLSAVTQGAPGELVTTASVRARFCESAGVAAGLGHQRLDLFMAGMFSVLDLALGVPLEDALSGLPVSADCRRGLTRGDNAIGVLLDAVRASERADWDAVESCAARLGLATGQLGDAYVEAAEWASRTARPEE